MRRHFPSKCHGLSMMGISEEIPMKLHICSYLICDYGVGRVYSARRICFEIDWILKETYPAERNI